MQRNLARAVPAKQLLLTLASWLYNVMVPFREIVVTILRIRSSA